jgi:uncharacterized protein (TIGR02271 family)
MAKRRKPQTPAAQTTQVLPVVAQTDEPVVIPVIEEYLEVEKTWAEVGEVLIKKSVGSRTETVPVELGYEMVQVERVPVNRILGEGEPTTSRQEGDTLVIPVVEEELVVMKRRVIREEIRVTKQRLARQQEVSEVLQSERISIETSGNLQTNTAGDGASA